MVKPFPDERDARWGEALLQHSGRHLELLWEMLGRLRRNEVLSEDRRQMKRWAKELAERIPAAVVRTISGVDDINGQLDKIAACTMDRRDGSELAAFALELHERLLDLYVAMARAIAYHHGLYNALPSPPGGWFEQYSAHYGHEQEIPFVCFPASGQTRGNIERSTPDPKKKAWRLRLIANRIRADRIPGVYAALVDLMDRIAGEDYNPETRSGIPDEPLRGRADDTCTANFPTIGAGFGSVFRKLRNHKAHSNDPPKFGLTAVEQLDAAASIVLMAVLMPWLYFELIHRDQSGPLRYSRQPDAHSRDREKIVPGSSLDAVGWVGPLLWFMPVDAVSWTGLSNERPGEAQPQDAFRLMPLFPLALGVGALSGVFRVPSQKGALKDGARLHLVRSLWSDRKGNISVDLYTKESHCIQKARFKVPYTRDCGSRRTFLRIEAKDSRQDLLSELRRILGKRRGVELVQQCWTEGKEFPVEVDALTLPKGPLTRYHSRGVGECPYTSTVACIVFIPEGCPSSQPTENDSTSWVLPTGTVPFRISEDILKRLEPTGDDGEPLTSGLSSHALYLLVEHVGRDLEKLQDLLARLQHQTMQESPWVPDLVGKGFLRLYSNEQVVNLPVIMEPNRSLGRLLSYLDQIREDLCTREFMQWERAEILVPWMLWVLVSASRGLRMLQVSGLEQHPSDPEHIGWESGGASNWWRVLDFKQALDEPVRNMGDFGDKLNRWSIPSDKGPPPTAGFAILAHDILFFLESGALPDNAHSWGGLDLDVFTGAKRKPEPGTFLSAKPFDASSLHSCRTAARITARFRKQISDYRPSPEEVQLRGRINQLEAELVQLVEALKDLPVLLKQASSEGVNQQWSAIGRSAREAIEQSFSSSLMVLDLYYAAAVEDLVGSVERGDGAGFKQARNYLEALKLHGPRWSDPVETLRSESGGLLPWGFNDLTARIAEGGGGATLDWQDASLEVLRELRFRVREFLRSPPEKSCGRHEFGCHRSLAMTCPCTQPLRDLVDCVRTAWDEDCVQAASPTHRQPPTEAVCDIFAQLIAVIEERDVRADTPLSAGTEYQHLSTPQEEPT